MSKLYHGITNHNKWIRKGYPCPYCLGGRKAAHESLLMLTDEQMEEYILKETEKIKTGLFDDKHKTE